MFSLTSQLQAKQHCDSKTAGFDGHQESFLRELEWYL
jgi:hypothetical protein